MAFRTSHRRLSAMIASSAMVVGEPSEGQVRGLGRSSARFGVVVALTHEYLKMASGLLAALRREHPDIDLFIYTDAASVVTVKQLADAFSATDLTVQRVLSYPCGDWSPIVTVKFEIFGRRYPEPLVYLDVDQILYHGLSPFVDAFTRSGAILAGSSDDESFTEQFKLGASPLGIAPDAPAINTGAFVFRTDPALHRLILNSLDYFSERGRLPTQSVINGLVQMEGLPLHLFGESFMAGPFSRRVLDQPRTSALIHFWTPRPPFMTPNPVRQGEAPYEVLKYLFEERFGIPYPEQQLEQEYRNQLKRASQYWPDAG